MELKLAGTGTELEKFKSGATKNVEFLGFQQREQLNKFLRDAKAVVVPSQWYETFGMIIAEAYAAHKAVIVGDIGNIATLVDDDKTGLKFKYNDYRALADTLTRFEKLDWCAMGERGYERFVTEFSPESNYQKLKALYDKVMR